MKRTGNLFSKCFTEMSLYQGYVDAAKSKKGRRGCHRFERSLGLNISLLHDEIASGNYKPRPYYSFVIKEPKERVIYAPSFRDCVVQHAIYRVISPLFERTFIDQSYACRKNKGTHKAADYTQMALQKSDSDSYILQLDIRKFFYRIDRHILKELIERKIKDKRFVDIMMLFTDYERPIGIPIGNLLSQIYALIYMNPVDQFIKRELKVKLYCRYVDDFILFNLSKSIAIEYKEIIARYLSENLKLELSKAIIVKTNKGVNFVGYRTWRRNRFIRKHSLYNYRKAIKNDKLESAVSILGHAKKTSSINNLLTFTKNKYNDNYHKLPKVYQRRNNKAD